MLVKRIDEEAHAACACPKRPTACPRDCGAVVPFDTVSEHLELCPLEEVACPHFLSLGCQGACPGRMPRRDLGAHLIDPFTLAAVVNHLQQQTSEYQKTIAALTQEALQHNELRREEYETKIADLMQQEEVRNRRMLRHLTRVHEIFWTVPPCPISEAVMVDQLSQQKEVQSGWWTTKHFAFKVPASCFSNSNHRFRYESKRFKVCNETFASVIMQEHKGGKSVECSVNLDNFGTAEFTVTAFRFGKCPPKQHTITQVSNSTNPTFPCFFDETDIRLGGWLREKEKLNILVTIHLQMLDLTKL